MLALVMLTVALSVFAATPTQAQSSSTMPDWQIAAGGHMEFDVASVKPNATAPGPETTHSNVPLVGPGPYYSPTGGLFSATNFSLFRYIAFAYKTTGNQDRALRSQVPKWVLSDRFDIEARAGGNPTKDQLRLMTQSLLAGRFKLTMHYETRQLPVFVLVLEEPGKLSRARKTGTQLKPHSDDTKCVDIPVGRPNPSAALGAPFLGPCGGIRVVNNDLGGQDMVGRNVTMEQLAGTLSVLELDRDVVDRTGLNQTFDVTLHYQIARPGADTSASDPSGLPSIFTALREQLGLKLESQEIPIDVLVIDHVEKPSEN